MQAVLKWNPHDADRDGRIMAQALPQRFAQQPLERTNDVPVESSAEDARDVMPPFVTELGEGLRRLDYSPDGETIAVAGEPHVFLVDADTGAVLQRTEGNDGRLSSDSFSPDGTFVRHIRSRAEPVESVAWHPDGNILLFGSRDGTLTAAEVATGRMLVEFRAHGSRPTFGLQFSPDGNTIATCGRDGT